MIIKDCPFCGSKAKLIRNTFGDSYKENYAISCTGKKTHQMDYWGDTEQEAVDEWNERIPEDISKEKSLRRYLLLKSECEE